MELGAGKDAVELADEDFLRSLAEALRPGGVVSTPADTIRCKDFSVDETFARCRRIFGGSVDYAWTTVPSYYKWESFTLLSPFLFSVLFPFPFMNLRLGLLIERELHVSSAALSGSCCVPRRDQRLTSRTP